MNNINLDNLAAAEYRFDRAIPEEYMLEDGMDTCTDYVDPLLCPVFAEYVRQAAPQNFAGFLVSESNQDSDIWARVTESRRIDQLHAVI